MSRYVRSAPRPRLFDTRWTEGKAACDTGQPELYDLLFFPVEHWKEDKSTPLVRERIREAKRICSGCEIRPICLARAIEERDPWAIRGGLTPPERANLKRRKRGAA